MKPLIAISFEQVPFPSAEEEVAATQLTLGNIQFLKNLISSLMQELTTMKLLQGKEAEYAQKVAYIHGQVAAYTYLIEAHETSYLATSNISEN